MVERIVERGISVASSKETQIENLQRKSLATLRACKQWVAWRSSGDKKIPINPKTGGQASVTKPITWATFTQAIEFWEAGEADGVGFVLTKDDPFIVVDLDDCRDPDTKRLTPEAQGYLKELGSYGEVSPSGTGVHIWMEGTIPRNVRKDGVEIYGDKRFMTVTGRWLSRSTPDRINNGENQLQTLYRNVADNDGVSGSKEAPQGVTDQELDRVLREIRQSRDAGKFDQLWAGTTDGYPSQSEADLALCRLLAIYSGCSEVVVDNLFRRSELFRGKWDEFRSDGRTYGQMTIAKARGRVMDELQQKWAVKSAKDIDQAQPDEVTADDLVDGLIPRRSLGIVVGHSSLGKRPLLYQAGICVAAGIPFLNRRVEQGRVLYLDFENGTSQSVGLIRRITSHLGLSEAPEDFYYWNLNAASAGWEQRRTLEMVRNFKPDFVILDSFTTFSPKIEDRNSQATQVLLKLRKINREIGSAIWGTHHLAKPPARRDRAPEPLEKCNVVRNWFFQARGASALINGTDVRVGVEEPLLRTSVETATGGREEVALVLRGFRRVSGEIPLIYLARVFDESGEPIGYRELTGSRLLFNSDQEIAFNKLPAEFRFKDAELAYGRGSQATFDFLKKCINLQILRKTEAGYQKIEPN